MIIVVQNFYFQVDNGNIEDAEEKGNSLEVQKKIPCVPDEALTFFQDGAAVETSTSAADLYHLM